MNDSMWVTVRYALIGLGSYFAGRGKLDPAQVAPMADQLISIASGAVALGTAVWGFYVRFRTVAVPLATAARKDVPTISPATGVTIPGNA